MSITTLSSSEFDQETSRAMKDALKGPIFITEWGSPAYVLLSIDEYRSISGQRRNIVEILSMPEVSNIEFDPVPSSNVARATAFSFDDEVE